MFVGDLCWLCLFEFVCLIVFGMGASCCGSAFLCLYFD